MIEQLQHILAPTVEIPSDELIYFTMKGQKFVGR